MSKLFFMLWHTSHSTLYHFHAIAVRVLILTPTFNVQWNAVVFFILQMQFVYKRNRNKNRIKLFVCNVSGVSFFSSWRCVFKKRTNKKMIHRHNTLNILRWVHWNVLLLLLPHRLRSMGNNNNMIFWWYEVHITTQTHYRPPLNRRSYYQS